eukprot:12643108-Prorocentrum_lima.AAC.1
MPERGGLLRGHRITPQHRQPMTLAGNKHLVQSLSARRSHKIWRYFSRDLTTKTREAGGVRGGQPPP